jgi:energy-coupling factor transporter ATP-binding protein EcfA2
MYLRRLAVENIRSISRLSLDFEKGTEAGWHVILGLNGSGKSSLVRAFALLMMGEKEVYAARQEFGAWISENKNKATIDGSISMDGDFDDLTGSGPPPKKTITLQVIMERENIDYPVDLKFSGQGFQRTIWGNGSGWFSASFGPYRRFSGGDNKYDRLFVTNKRLAPHLTALGEDVALTDAMLWLSNLFTKVLIEEKRSSSSGIDELFKLILGFLNSTGFLPHKSKIHIVHSEAVLVKDGNGNSVPLDQLSDGYRSALSLVIELLRQIYEIYGHEKLLIALKGEPGVIKLPGVVMIDEIDVHLHPMWQKDIGQWLTQCFPNIQFIVTTHSPIICRAVASENGDIRGSIWKLPTQGTEEKFKRADSLEMNQLIYGNLLDAYSTELFGKHVVRSDIGEKKLERLAELNIKALEDELSSTEEDERQVLRATFPAKAGFFKRT